MDNIPFHLRPFKNRLSPFGQNVFNVLLELRSSERSYYNNSGENQQKRDFMEEIGGSSSRYSLNKRPSWTFPENTEQKINNNFGRKKCQLKFLEKGIPLASKPYDLRNVNSVCDKHGHDIFSRDDLVTAAIRIEEPLDEYDCRENNQKNYNVAATAVDATQALVTNCIPAIAQESSFSQSLADDVKWSNMFDTELFEGSTQNDLLSVDENYLENTSLNKPHVDSFKKPDGNLPKRKNSAKLVIDLHKFKRVKTIQDSKNIYQKEKITTTVKKWLNDVEQALADGKDENEELNSTKENEESEPNSFKKIISKKALQTKLKQGGAQVKSKHDLNMIKENKESLDHDIIAKKQTKKKVVQAQLANKGGKMKFGKPKNIATDEDKNTEYSSAVPPAKPEKEVVKEKKAKSKFVTPIKPQIPVKDVTYKIITIDEENIDIHRDTLQSVENSKVFVVLVYRNGLCQLNGCFTEDTIPEGIILSFADEDDGFYYFTKIDESLRTTLCHIFENNVVICYEGKSIMIFLSYFNVNFKPVYFEDAKIGGALLDPESLPETFSDLQKLVGFAPEFTIAADSWLQKAAWFTTLLRDCSAKLKALLVENSLWKVFVDIEMRLLPIIADMESRGVAVDLDKLKSMEQVLITKMKEIEQQCYKAAGRAFQINSTPQVRALLFDELKLDAKCNVKITETLVTGAKSTAEATLRSLMSVHPLPRLILEYRHLHKAHATFLTGVAHHVRDGVVRPTWVQIAAATGRIASNNPNLQAIPKGLFSLTMFPDSDGVDNPALNFRSVYVSRAGFTFLAADFRHVECRVFAHAAGDTALLGALAGRDLFRVLAAKWLNKSEECVSVAERERTKRVVYASLYGCGARKLMDVLGVSYDRALQALSSFNATFPSLRAFGRSVCSACAAADGQLRTPGGRARRLRHIHSRDVAAKAHAERQAVNFIVQGTAADLCKMAMILVDERLRAHSPPLRAHLVLQIHDELVWEVHDDDLQEVAGVVKEAMEGAGGACGLSLRLPVARAQGGSWGHLTPMP